MSEKLNEIECTTCGAGLQIPGDIEEGTVTCEKCEATYMFGRTSPGPTKEFLQTADAYYKFIAPEMIALNRKALLFHELNPDAELFNEQTLEEAEQTIAELQELLDHPEEPTA